MIKTIVGIVMFALIAGIYLYLALNSKNGSLAYKNSMGVKSQMVESSPERWMAGHKAAWPLFAAGGVVSLFHLIGVAIGGFVMPKPDGPRFVDVLILSGLVVCIALYFVATAAAKDAASRLADPPPDQSANQPGRPGS